MKKKFTKKKLLLYLFFSILLCMNLINFFQKFYNELEDGYQRYIKGGFFFRGQNYRTSTLELPQKHLNENGSLFVWHPISNRYGIGVEAEIGNLSYYLMPSKIHYLCDEKINECDFIMSEKSLYFPVRRSLYNLDITDNFVKIDENDRYFLMEKIR